jgi:hypothetical protein
LILLFGTPTATTTLPTTLAVLLTTLVLTTLAVLLTTLVLTTLATLTPLLAALILILILILIPRHYITSLVWGYSQRDPTAQVFNTFLIVNDRFLHAARAHQPNESSRGGQRRRPADTHQCRGISDERSGQALVDVFSAGGAKQQFE